MFWLGAVDKVLLIEKDPRVVELWQRLLAMTPREVLALEPPVAGDYTDDFLWMTAATSNAIGSLRRLKMPERVPEVARGMLRQIAATLPEAKRKVTVIEGDYLEAPDVEATWFIDPPYQVNGSGSEHTWFPQGMGYGHGCRSSDLDFAALGEWCQSRQGQVMVCEQSGATWLPFTSLGDSKEAGWRNNDVAGTLFHQPLK